MTFFYKNLVPGQWQIGDIVMGYGTNIIVESIENNPYDVNAQDYQVSRADETRFGADTFKPTSMSLTMDVLHNRLLPGFEGSIPNFWHSNPTIHDLQREWRFDEGRSIWNQMKPLYHCSKLDLIPKIIYGRPGQFKYKLDDEFNQGEVMNVLAEFRFGDTYSYSVDESGVLLTQAAPEISIIGTQGNAPSWMRILIAGPVVHPVITLTNLYQQSEPVVIDFDYTLGADDIVEISGYPWSRRVVNNANPPLSLPASLIGDTPYLDRLRFDFNSAVDIHLTATSGMTADTKVEVIWRDAYQVI